MDTPTRTVRDHRWPLLALTGLVIVTVGWWAAALWPLSPATPEWVVRARAACFGSTPSGLPNSGGWILLIGTPPSLLAALLVISGPEVRAALRSVRLTGVGRFTLRAVAVSLVVLSGLAASRVASAYGLTDPWAATEEPGIALPADRLVRSTRAAPPLELVDQHGETTRLADLRGRPVLVTFAFGKCETVCPVLVHNVLAARNDLMDVDPAVLVVTLDPWRDTPSRLSAIAESWGMTGDAHVLGGSVEDVEAALDEWGIERSRDPRTGDINHAVFAHVVDREGRIAFTVAGSAERIVDAVRRID